LLPRSPAPLARCARIEGCRMTDAELARKNLIWGLALFGLYLLLLGLTVVIALVYLALD
jgi:hypothetical protein